MDPCDCMVCLYLLYNLPNKNQSLQGHIPFKYQFHGPCECDLFGEKMRKCGFKVFLMTFLGEK